LQNVARDAIEIRTMREQRFSRSFKEQTTCLLFLLIALTRWASISAIVRRRCAWKLAELRDVSE
jgi:hypothetical protein